MNAYFIKVEMHAVIKLKSIYKGWIWKIFNKMRNYELLQNYYTNTKYHPNLMIETRGQGVFICYCDGTFSSFDCFRVKRNIDEGKYIVLKDNIDLCYDDLEFYI